MLSDLNDACDLNNASVEMAVLLKAANLLGVDVRSQWGETNEIKEDK